MKLEQKDLDKLKQSDRIEFFTRLNRLENLKPEFNSTFWMLMVLSVVIVFLTALGLAMIESSSVSNVLAIGKIGKVFVIVGFTVDLFVYVLRLIKYYKKIEELDHQFFETQIK